jgi:hypothetical protein
MDFAKSVLFVCFLLPVLQIIPHFLNSLLGLSPIFRCPPATPQKSLRQSAALHFLRHNVQPASLPVETLLMPSAMPIRHWSKDDNTVFQQLTLDAGSATAMVKLNCTDVRKPP